MVRPTVVVLVSSAEVFASTWAIPQSSLAPPPTDQLDERAVVVWSEYVSVDLLSLALYLPAVLPMVL